MSKDIVYTVPKKETRIILPYLGVQSLKLRTRLTKVFSESLRHCSLKVIFKSSCRLSNLFSFKDRIPLMLRSGIVYNFTCVGCNANYYGKTIRHFKVRACEHLRISPLTGESVSPGPTAVSEHLKSCRCSPSLRSFKIITSESNDFKLTVMESLLIQRDKPPLNRTVKSMPLELF